MEEIIKHIKEDFGLTETEASDIISLLRQAYEEGYRAGWNAEIYNPTKV